MNQLMKLMEFMQGRYGRFDEFSKLISITGLILTVLSFFFGGWPLRIIGLIGIVYAVYRPISKNTDQRVRELRWYLSIKQKVLNIQWKMKSQTKKAKSRWNQRKTHKFYNCPECNQKVRVPKTNKKIRITCPACGHQFFKKT